MKTDIAKESLKAANLLKSKPEVDRKIIYYKSVLEANEQLLYSIVDTIENGYEKVTIVVLGISITLFKKKLSEYSLAQLKIEEINLLSKIYMNKQYFDMWDERREEYEIKFDEYMRECNENFDTIFKDAQKAAQRNPRLKLAMDNYENKDNDERLRVDYYLYLKQEVANSKLYGGSAKLKKAF